MSTNQWQHGYFAESGYTYGHYPETLPNRLQWLSLLRGHQTPISKFRYLDAGCGQGVGLVIAAAMHPDSEFVGIDFMPEHIAHGRRLAALCGLSNVQFIEGDFVALAAQPVGLGQFDYAVAHGISTWIAPDVKKAMFKLISDCLNPGGVFYNSYNTYPGWLGTTALQRLVLLHQKQNTGAAAITAAQASMEALEKAGAQLFSTQPALKPRIDSMKGKDPAYLVQEYNNQHWQPVFVSEMMESLEQVKLQFLGTATMPDVFGATIKPELRTIMAAQQDAKIREQLLDYGVNQTFRRDLYVKGVSRTWRGQQLELIQQRRFVLNPVAARPELDKPFVIRGGSSEINGTHTAFAQVLDLIGSRAEGMSLAELEANLPESVRAAALATACYLESGHWLMSMNSAETRAAAKSPVSRTVKAMLQQVGQGAPYTVLPTALGCSLPLGQIDQLMMALDSDGVNQNDFAQRLLQRIIQLGMTVNRNGQALKTTDEQLAELTPMVSRYFDKTRRGLISLGLLPA